MMSLRRGHLPLLLAVGCLFALLQSATAQYRPGSRPRMPRGGNPGNPFGNQNTNPFGNPNSNPPGNPATNPFGNPNNNPFGNQNNPPGNPGANPFQQMNNDPPTTVTFNPPPGAAAASGVGTGMIIGGIFLITLGLGLTAGVVYLGLQGQKTSYTGGARRRRKARDND